MRVVVHNKLQPKVMYVLVQAVRIGYGPSVCLVSSIHGMVARHVTSNLRSTVADEQTRYHDPDRRC